MHYRAATFADAEQIAQLHAASWQRTYRGMLSDDYLDNAALADRRHVWDERLAPPRSGQIVAVADPRGTARIDTQFVAVAEEDGEIHGFVCVYGDADPAFGSLIDNLHVRHEHKSRGIGRQLMREAAAWLDEGHSARGVYLWVMELNTDAQAFYRRLGGSFRDIKESQAPGGGTTRGIRIVWPDLELLLAPSP